MNPVAWKSDRFLLGLTGMPGAGKSTARKILESMGCIGIDADALAHLALQQEDTMATLARIFGPEVISNGKPDRKRIAAIVFQDDTKLQKLNQIIHPIVRQLAEERFQSMPAGSIGVYDVPLLFETGDTDIYDATLAVESSFETRLKRVAARQWDRTELESRDRHHLPDKGQRATFAVSNDGEVKDLEEKLRAVVESIRAGREQ